MAYNYEWPYVGTDKWNADWMLSKMKEIIIEWAKMQTGWDDLNKQFNDLKTYIYQYFENLDITAELKTILDGYVADGTLNTLIESITSIYSTLSAAVESNIQKPEGTKIIVLSHGNYNKSSVWTVMDASDGMNWTLKTAGKWISYSEEIFNARQVPESILTEETFVQVVDHFKSIYFPAGEYAGFNISLIGTVCREVYGDGDKSVLYAGNGELIHIGVNYAYIHDLALVGIEPYQAVGINKGKWNESHHFHLENVRIENFSTGIRGLFGAIWDRYVNVGIRGCTGNGLDFSQGTPYNNNLFQGCYFERNGGYNVIISPSDWTLSFGNVFNGCTFELAGFRGNIPAIVNPNSAVYLEASTSMQGCYFEGNGEYSGIEAVILTNRTINLTGCSFIMEKKPLIWLLRNPKACFTGCDSFECTGGLNHVGEGTIEQIGSNLPV